MTILEEPVLVQLVERVPITCCARLVPHHVSLGQDRGRVLPHFLLRTLLLLTPPLHIVPVGDHVSNREIT